MNENVEKAFSAWQAGDSGLFLSYFVNKALLIDSAGNRKILKRFVNSVCGYAKFTSIYKIANQGNEIRGILYCENWGELKTYFEFVANEDGKFTQLQVGLY